MVNFIESCINCGGKRLQQLSGFEAAWLVKCRECGMVFSSRNPTTEELENHYKGYGRNDYLSPLTVKRYNEILDKLEKFRKTNKLIDVGCGIGYFAEVAISRGWEVYGTEFTDNAIAICEAKGIQMQKGVLNPDNYEAGSFDVVTSFEVIEHINNPIAETSNFNKLLRKGGALYITTPNFNSLLRYYLKGNYNVIGWPEHLSYYTPATLNSLLKSQGFKKVFIQATGISLTRLKTSQGKQEERDTAEGTEFVSASTTDEKLRNSMEKNFLLNTVKQSINGVLTLWGKGDALKGLFVKH